MKRKVFLAVAVFLLLSVTATTVAYINKNAKTTADQQLKLQNSKTQLIKVNDTLDKVKQEKVEDNDAAQQQIQKLEKEKKDLQDQLQAKVEQKRQLAEAQVATPVVVPTPAVQPLQQKQIDPAQQITYGCGDNYYAAYIYGYESGGHVVGNCDTKALNSIGCLGIGQACPSSKLTDACPNLDYACENAFFTDYAISKYGSWEGAYNTWLSQHWW